MEIERTVADRVLDKEGPREPPGWPEGDHEKVSFAMLPGKRYDGGLCLSYSQPIFK